MVLYEVGRWLEVGGYTRWIDTVMTLVSVSAITTSGKWTIIPIGMFVLMGQF